MTKTNTWKSFQRALTDLTHRRKARLARMALKKKGKSLPIGSPTNSKGRKLSQQFRNSKPGTPGRRATRHLDDQSVHSARIKSRDMKHQFKFLGRGQRMAITKDLALAS